MAQHTVRPHIAAVCYSTVSPSSGAVVILNTESCVCQDHKGHQRAGSYIKGKVHLGEDGPKVKKDQGCAGISGAMNDDQAESTVLSMHTHQHAGWKFKDLGKSLVED